MATTQQEIAKVHDQARSFGFTEDEIRAISEASNDRGIAITGLNPGNAWAHKVLASIKAAFIAEHERRSGATAPAPASRPANPATDRQIDYIRDLGGNPDLSTLTKADASAMIESLKAANAARAAGRRHGVRGEIWD